MLTRRIRSAEIAVVVALLAVIAFLAPGCSGDDSAPSGGSGVTCAQACAGCLTPSICADCAGHGASLRDEFEGPLYACVVREADAGCLTDWERCVGEAIGKVAERDIDRSFRADCLARRTECQNQMMGFADDACLTSGAFVESVVTKAQPCLGKACGEIGTCLNDTFR